MAIRIFLTGTVLAGVTQTGRTMGLLLDPTVDTVGAPYGRGGGWRARLGGRAVLLRKTLGRYVAYDHVRDARDPEVAAEADFLRSADGVLFVADSQAERREANVAALDRLIAALKQLGRDPARIPFVFALNKRDLPGAAPVADLTADLQPGDAVWVPTVATTGQGIAEAFGAIVAAADRER